MARVAGKEEIRLERAEALGNDLPSQRGHVLHCAQRRRAHQFVHPDTARTAVGPVDAHLVAQWAAEQLGHRAAARPRGNVNQRQLDAGNCLGANAAGAGLQRAVHVPPALFKCSRVAAQH